MLSEQIQSTIAGACVTVVKLGGRGVLVPGNLVLTAAHCVTYTTDGAMVLGDFFIEELQTTQGMVKVQPLAIEPVTDIAVLGALDGQGFYEECHAFEDWCANTPPVPLCVQNFPLFESFPVYVYTHTQKWIQARATLMSTDAQSVWVDVPEQIEGGTSGSPIVTERGELIGIVSNTGSGPNQADCNGIAPRPSLALPVWVFHRIQGAQGRGE